MENIDNKRESGTRKPTKRKNSDARNEFSQDAAKNRKPSGGMGNTRDPDDTNEKTRHSDHE